MTEKILVTLKKNDRVDEVLPYVRQLARSGMKVVFLLPECADGFEYLLRHKVIMETGLHAGLANKEKSKRYMAEVRRNFAWQKISLAADKLRKDGVEIRADFYSGSLANALKNYSADANTHLTIISARRPALITLLYLVFWILKRQTLSSVLLLRSPITDSN